MLATVSHEQGRLRGSIESLGFDLRNEAQLRTLSDDVIKSSEIEGEELDRDQVRSSIARRLGMDIAGLAQADRNVEGVVEMMLDATEKYDEELTDERLCGWHAALFPTGRSGMTRINAGAWRDARDGPMQMVSGPVGREKVHYEAPAADRVQKEMRQFLAWFRKPGDAHPLLVAGLAHLWFVTIHPFDDGNGRIARAVADMALARSERTRQRFYSMSSQIRLDRKDYYYMLEWTQKGDMEITRWQEWILDCLLQIMMMNKLLDGFEGKLTSSKWAKIAKCSQDTATRDIKDLIKRGSLKQDEGGGRSTSYSLVAG